MKMKMNMMNTPSTQIISLLILAIVVVGFASGAHASRIHRQSSVVNSDSPSAPVAPTWPLQFNSTLIKVGPEPFPTNIQWTKLYYDAPNARSRFDFYSSYYGEDLQWTANFTILFLGTDVWYITPLDRSCTIRSCALPPVSPTWVSNTTYRGSFPFRGGVWAERWEFDDGMQYWTRYDNGIRIPLRSTNQKEDPGFTDYVDVVVGPQDPDLFQVPEFCDWCPSSASSSSASVEEVTRIDSTLWKRLGVHF